jgi:hypothetical protein
MNLETAKGAPARTGNALEIGEHVSKQLDQRNTQKSGQGQALWLNLDAIREMAEMIESLAISLRLAAWRGSPEACGVHLIQLRLALIEAIGTFKEIGGGQ